MNEPEILPTQESKSSRRKSRLVVFGLIVVVILALVLSFVWVWPDSPLRLALEGQPTQASPDPTNATTGQVVSPGSTQTPQPPALVSIVTVNTTPYTDTQGLFTLLIPEGWVTSEDKTGLIMRNPQTQDTVNMRLDATGYTLDEESFLRCAVALDQNALTGLTITQQEASDPQVSTEEGSLLTLFSKIVETSKGEQVYVLSLYRQLGQVVAGFDSHMAKEADTFTKQTLKDLALSLKVDSQKIIPYAKRQNYSWEGAFSVEIPVAWQHEIVKTSNSLVDTFTSPDDQAFFQVIHFDDGISLSRKAAGAFTLSILKNYYAPDLSISENRLVLPEVEMITWSSTKTQVEGQTYFMLDGTSLWLYSGVYKQEQAELYAVLFEEIMESVAFIK